MGSTWQQRETEAKKRLTRAARFAQNNEDKTKLVFPILQGVAML